MKTPYNRMKIIMYNLQISPKIKVKKKRKNNKICEMVLSQKRCAMEIAFIYQVLLQAK